MAYDPVMGSNPFVAAMEGQRARVEQTRENTARLAQSYATLPTEGVGEFSFTSPVFFGCTFKEQPRFAYGYSVKGDLIAGQTPRSVGFVRDWVRDSRGFYVGAYCVFGVDVVALTPRSTATTPTEDGKVLARFEDTFDRPDSGLVGNGWTQTGGDWAVSNNRVSTPTGNSYLWRPFDRVAVQAVSSLRSPDGGHPVIFAWSKETARTGYALAFSAVATGTNVELYRDNVRVASGHFGPTNTAIGNVQVVTRLLINVLDGATVRVRGYLNDTLVAEYSESLSTAPLGNITGVGNNNAGNVSSDYFVSEELAGTTSMNDPASSGGSPTYSLRHDLTFTGVALKDLPDYVMDSGEPPAYVELSDQTFQGSVNFT